MNLTRSSKKGRFKREHGWFYIIMLAFPTIQFLIFYIAVNFNSIIMVFQKYDANTATYVFEGVSNFKEAFKMLTTNDNMIMAIRNSFIGLFSGIFTLFLSALFSFYIFKKRKFSGLFKVILFLPAIISSAAMTIMFRYFTDQAIPAILKLIGISSQGMFSVPDLLPTIVFYSIWIGFASTILLLLGDMERINESIIESAELDGASSLREFFSIVLPLIYPTITTFLVVQVGAIFTNQLNIFTFFGGNSDLKTMGYYLYSKVQSSGVESYPRLAAFGVMCTFVTIPLTFIVRWLLNKYGPSVER